MVILKFNWVRNKSEKENYLKVGDRHRQIQRKVQNKSKLYTKNHQILLSKRKKLIMILNNLQNNKKTKIKYKNKKIKRKNFQNYLKIYPKKISFSLMLKNFMKKK